MNSPHDFKEPQGRWAAYLRWMFGTLFAVLLLVAAVNVAVDPLDVFGTPRVSGFNAVKPHLDHHRELTRWRQAKRLCPSAVILGNSRAEIGFDPEHPAFAAQGLSAVNQAVPGTAASTAYRQLLWLQSVGCMPRTIVLGVEFFDFLGGAPATPLPRPGTESPPALDPAFFAEAVFSITGLGDSLGTLALQRARYPATLTDRGFNPLYNYVGEVAQAGHFPLFRQRAVENARNWARKPARLKPPGGGDSEDSLAVQAILALAAQAGSSVHVVIYPYHAQIRLMLERLELGELFSTWKAQIVTLAAAAPTGRGSVSVWDFSGLSPQTQEPIPGPKDRQTKLQHYWEGGHFKKELGDLALARMLGNDNGFGVRLNSENTAAWLAQDRAAVLALLVSASPLRTDADEVIQRALPHKAP